MTNIFAAYSDESFHEQYQAIGVVSGKKILLSNLREKLQNILNDRNIKELKFSKLGTRFPKVEAAKKSMDLGIEFCKKNLIRIDILIWDLKDSRHSIPNMDTIANLAYMYYKILRCISEQWNHRYWEFYPDEQSSIEWYKIANYLNRTIIHRRKPHFLTLFEQDKHRIKFIRLNQLKSHEEPLIQLADLFAGIACFSRKKSDECWIEYNKRKKQQSLFREETEMRSKLSGTDLNRFKLIFRIYKICKKFNLNVSLKRKKYLWTPDPSYPINFWHYEPQHERDKAPIK